MPISYNLRKHELECMRLAIDCKRLAREVDDIALQSHFLQMAKIWSNLADQGPGAYTH